MQGKTECIATESHSFCWESQLQIGKKSQALYYQKNKKKSQQISDNSNLLLLQSGWIPLWKIRIRASVEMRQVLVEMGRMNRSTEKAG